jgi:glycosyltransferase involved in cell wall biosynthesis
MKIAYLAPSWPLSDKPNGIVSYLTVLTQAIEELGHEVFIATLAVQEPCDDGRVVRVDRAVHRTTLGRLAQGVMFRLAPERTRYCAHSRDLATTFRALVERERLDVIQMEETFGWSRRVAHDVRVPVITRLHGPYFLNGQYEARRARSRSFRLRSERAGIVAAAGITAPSRQVLDATVEYYSLPFMRRQVIQNPVIASDVRASWSLAECRRNELLFVGRTDWRKGGDLVVKAFSKLHERNPNLKLHFVGPDRGFEDDKGRVHTWREFAADNVSPQAQSRIQFHGALRPGAIAPLRRRCFATLVFSRYETFGNVCTEAMACGAPLVATNVGGIGEIVHHGRNGLLANPKSLSDLVAKVQLLLDQPETAADLGRTAWLDCQRQFNPAVIAEATVDFYESVRARFQHRR